MRPLLRGLILLALLTGVALAVWRVPWACGARSARSAGSGPRAAPALLLAPDSIDLGRLAPGSRHEVEVAWRFTGEAPVAVLATATGCGCLGWQGWPAVLPARGEGRVRLALRASDRPGPMDSAARLVLDLPAPGDVVRVRVRAYVGGAAVVRPESVDLGLRSPGASVPVRLSVHLPPGRERESVSATLTPWAGSVRVERAALLDQRGPDLVLSLTLPEAAGPTAALLTLLASGRGEACVPLRAEIVHPPSPRAPGPR